MHECGQLMLAWRLDAMEVCFAVAVFGIDAVEKQHVVMNVEVERRAKSLDDGHRASVRRGLSVASDLDQMSGQCSVDNAQHFTHQLRVTSQQKAQLKGETQYPLADRRRCHYDCDSVNY